MTVLMRNMVFHKIFRRLFKRKLLLVDIQNKSVPLNLFDRLPLEIWLMIYQSLDAADAVCLALSTVSMLRVFGNESFGRFKNIENRLARVQLLLRLEENSHPLCFECLKLHPRKRSEDLSRKHCDRTREVLQTLEEGGAQLWDGVFLPFKAVQSVMRAHRQGSLDYGIHTAEFRTLCLRLGLSACRSPETHGPFWKHCYAVEITREEKPHLLLRSRSIIPTDRLFSHTPQTFRTYRVPRQRHLVQCWGSEEGIVGCRHGFTRGGGRHHLLTCALNKYFAPGVTYPKPYDQSVQVAARCRQCPTEYLVDLNANRVEFLVWMDLGDGKSPLQGEWAAIAKKAGLDAQGFPSTLQLLNSPAQMPVHRRFIEAASLGRDAPKQSRPNWLKWYRDGANRMHSDNVFLQNYPEYYIYRRRNGQPR